MLIIIRIDSTVQAVWIFFLCFLSNNISSIISQVENPSIRNIHIMKELQRKQRTRRIIYSVPVLIILSIITFSLARGAVRVMNKAEESKALSRDLAEKATALVLREQELEEGVSHLKTEEGIKGEIRGRFSVTEEGEYVAVVVDERSASSSTDASSVPWYKRFWAVIMGNK